jgi:hypothetical protein
MLEHDSEILGPTMQQEFPEVEKATRTDWDRSLLFTVVIRNLSIQGNIVDSGFLRVFSFPLLKGNPAKVLEKPYSIVVTEKICEEVFR